MRSAGLEPLEEYVNARTPWRCRCLECGRGVQPSFNRVQQGGGCKYCAPTGFDPSKPGVTYLLSHQGFRAWQVGITNQPRKRIADHRRHGWEVAELWEFADGHAALAVESMVLAGWRTRGFTPAVDREAVPQGGYTETVSWDDVPSCTLASLALRLAGAALEETDL